MPSAMAVVLNGPQAPPPVIYICPIFHAVSDGVRFGMQIATVLSNPRGLYDVCMWAYLAESAVSRRYGAGGDDCFLFWE